MPAVAQISVNFAQLSQIRSNDKTAPTNVRVVSPRTLTQYLLSNREQGENANSAGNSDTAYLNYQGGFISAGNKVNVKHDSDLQLRQNLDVEQRVFADSIFARRKGNTAETYKDSRSSSDLRSITLAPYETDLTANIISITTTPSTKNISLFMNFGNQGENSITLNNTNSDKTLNVTTGVFTIDAAKLDIIGAPVYIDETVEINKETTITDNIKVTGNLSLGTTSYNKFTIASATGNVAFTGNLTINTDKFTVASATGNTVIAGTLNVSGNTSIGGTTTLSNSITIGTGDTTSATRRIIGVRRLNGISDYIGSSYDNDAITVGDVKLFGFKTGMIMMWSPLSTDNYGSNFNGNGLGIGNMTGWAVCNGNIHSGLTTPDLENKFIVGGRSSDGLSNITGTFERTGGTTGQTFTISSGGLNITAVATGGAVGDTSLTNAQIASHYHGMGNIAANNNDGDFNSRDWVLNTFGRRRVTGEGFNQGTGNASSGNIATTNNIAVANGADHNHPFTNPTIAITQPAYTSSTLTHIPPFYSLIYIIKL